MVDGFCSQRYVLIADILQETFTKLNIPRLPFGDDNAGGAKILKRSNLSIQELLEGFATVTFPSSERIIAATILQKSLEGYLTRIGIQQ